MFAAAPVCVLFVLSCSWFSLVLVLCGVVAGVAVSSPVTDTIFELIEFNEVPDAEQYRETLKIKESLTKGKNIDE